MLLSVLVLAAAALLRFLPYILEYAPQAIWCFLVFICRGVANVCAYVGAKALFVIGWTREQVPDLKCFVRVLWGRVMSVGACGRAVMDRLEARVDGLRVRMGMGMGRNSGYEQMGDVNTSGGAAPSASDGWRGGALLENTGKEEQRESMVFEYDSENEDKNSDEEVRNTSAESGESSEVGVRRGGENALR